MILRSQCYKIQGFWHSAKIADGLIMPNLAQSNSDFTHRWRVTAERVKINRNDHDHHEEHHRTTVTPVSSTEITTTLHAVYPGSKSGS